MLSHAALRWASAWLLPGLLSWQVSAVLQSARFRNFKALRDLSIDLERLTVLVGANGCGKTSVLEGIDLVCRLHRRPLGAPPDDTLLDTEALLKRHPVEQLKTAGTDWPVGVELKGQDIHLLELRAPARRGDLFASPEVLTGSPKTLPRASRLRLQAERLALPSFIESGETPVLRPNGDGLASVLGTLAGRRSPALDRIEADLREIVPRVERVRVEPAKITREEVEYIKIDDEAIPRHSKRSYPGHRLELSLRGAGFLRAEAISEGTLLALGMLTVLHADDAPSLVLFDDIDRGLHPTAQRAVFACLRQILDARPDLQIVCTTHSPYALDCVRPEEVRVLKLDRAGHTHVRKLTDHPEWPQWKDHLAPGEFWSAYGEDWVYGEADAG